ncbi:MAG: hypothetical protein GC164_02560 [Phycisphaera sp.]|nr:hypothetical protein [Phycisphaera sp.]
MSALILSVVCTGCAAPPSVTPLMRMVQQSLEQEAGYLEHDTQLQSQHTALVLDTLESAFEKDLRERGSLDPQWVLDATRAYTAAREQVVLQDARLTASRTQRIENLLASVEAQQHAIGLLDQQDQLLISVLGTEGWSLGRMLLAPTPTPTIQPTLSQGNNP